MVVAVVLGLLIAIYFLFLRKDTSAFSGDGSLASTVKTKVDGIVLCGPCNGGKTVIFQQLCHGAMPTTVTSMAPAFGKVSEEVGGGKATQLVDFPGHERLRHSLLEHLKGARGLVLVVDASGSKQIKDASDVLYALLTAPKLSSTTPLLVFCNKSDVDGAKNTDRVRILLQKGG